MSDARKRGRRNRAKGGEYEREVAERFRLAGIAAIREGFKQRRKGDKEPDVAAGIFAVECKNTERLSIHAEMELADLAEGLPVLVWKRPRIIKGGKVIAKKSEVVCLRPETFFALATVFHRVWVDAASAVVTVGES